MPNRLIKESICTSQNLNELTPIEEIFFYRLIVNCDDFGRMDARPAILRARLFPLRTDNIKEDDIVNWLQSLVKQSLIDIYEVNEERFIQVRTWENHQQIRAKRSKYPDPDGNLITIDNIGNQVITSAIKSSRNPIQSESNPNPVAVVKDTTTLFIAYKEKLRTTYPNLNIDEEWERCQIWFRDHKKSIKSPSLALGNWCKKEVEIKEKARPGSVKGTVDPDKYIKGKYGHVVQR